MEDVLALLHASAADLLRAKREESVSLPHAV
jgi:hypothetical protein